MSRLVTSLPRLVRPNVRSFTRGEVRRADPKVVQQIKSRQEQFQARDSEPVYIKNGKIHFYVTTAAGVLAFAGCLHGLYTIVQG